MMEKARVCCVPNSEIECGAGTAIGQLVFEPARSRGICNPHFATGDRSTLDSVRIGFFAVPETVKSHRARARIHPLSWSGQFRL